MNDRLGQPGVGGVTVVRAAITRTSAVKATILQQARSTGFASMRSMSESDEMMQIVKESAATYRRCSNPERSTNRGHCHGACGQGVA